MAKKKPIVSPLGQWAYPGEVTIIPSSNITMKGVNYPVLGVDDLGNSQMMMPGQDYNFAGQYVTEYPQMQFGGMSKRKIDKILNQNKDLNFVQRMYQSNTPSIIIPGQKYPSTHFMESSDGRVYPTVVQMPDGSLQYLGDNAYDYANQTGQYIEFPNDRQARRFAKSYKKGTGVLQEFGKGGLRQWFAEEWTDVKTGKPCGRSGDEKGSRPYPACRPKKRVNETTPKTTSEMSSAEKAKFKREKTSGKRIDYNHKRRQDGGETGWLDEYQTGGSEQNPERMQGIDIKRKKKNVSDSPRYQYDDKGNLLYTPELSIWPYASDGSSRDEFLVNPKLSVQNLNPTLEEFINVASPYYPIDNKLVTDPKINLQSSNYQRSLEQEYVLPQIVGKSFGNLPIVKDDGYSPNRRWVSNLRAKDTGAKFGKDSYAYVLKTNPNNLVDYSTKKAIEAAVSSNDEDFYDYLAKNNYSPNMVQQLEKNRPDQIWNRAEQMRVEMRNNPEIMSWANLHNVDLGYKEKGKGDDSFASKIPESIYANRLVRAGLPTNRPDYEYKPMETYIVQDPSKFDLAGYFPMGSIVKDAEQKVLNKKIPGKLKREYIYSNSPEYFEKEAYIKDEMARRMGINPSAFDSGEYLIHYNQSPITEYTPGKKYGGWLEEYQRGGTLPPIYTSNPRKVQFYQDSLNLYNKYQPSFDKYKNWTRLNNIQTASLQGNDLFNQHWGPFKPKGPSPYNEHIVIKPVEEMMHHYLRPRGGPGNFTHLTERPGNNYLETKLSDYLTPNSRETRLWHAVDNNGRYLPLGVGITPSQKRSNDARRSRTWPVSVTKKDFLDLGLTGVTPDLNSVFRFKKPVQPYILTNPEITPKVVEPVSVVEPPKPSLFVSNIDRDMYTPGGGMAREYNIGVTLQDGNRKSFRTEKEFQDWKAANNLDISKAKVTEGRGYSYDYPENKKYGGWLNKYQTGGWAGWTPNVGKPYMRTSPAGNAGYTDNTRVVNQNTNVSAENRKAAEAAEYAKRVGSISQGKTKSAYEKAREASSLVAQAEQRKGSADPLDYVLDMVNPATYGFAGADLIGNTAMGVNNLAKGNFSEAAGNAFDAGMNALYLLPAKGVAKAIASPMAFRPVEGMMYRGLGKEGFRDAIESGVFRPKQLNYSPGRSLAEKANSPKQFSSTYYAPSKKFGVVERYGSDYVAEVPYNEADFFRRYSKRNDWSYSTPRQIPITEGRILKKDWLLGYKPIDVSNAQSSMNLSKMDGSYLVRELLGEAIKGNQNRKAIAEGNAWLKNWIDDPITQTKIDTDLGWIPQRSNILKDKFSLGYEQAKSFTPVSKEYPFSEQLNDYFIRVKPHIHSGNSGVSYLHSRDPYSRSISEQFNDPRLKASWISRNPSISKPVRRSTTVHEGTHDWTSDFLLRESGQMGDIRNLYSDDIRNLSDQWKSLRNSGINPSEVMGRENATLGYLADPTEVHARIMELRQLMKMTPEQSVMVTPEKAADIITKVQNPKNAKFVDPRFLDVIDKDPKKLATLFNRLWAVPAVATASQLLEQKNGGWLDTYQDGGENLPELNSKIDIANFYKNPLSEKYGIYQDPTDNTYKYYSKSAEEPNIPLKTFDFTNLGNIARRIDKKEITTPQPIKYNSKMIDYAADQDYLTALATEEFPIIPPSFKDVLSNIPKLETINTIPKPKALPNKQPAVNNAFTFDSNYWNSADVQAEVFNRQLKDNKWYGEFDKRGDNVLNRTDVKRNYDSEVFLQNLATPNSVVIDIGSALGNNNPKLAGVSVYELASNPKIKSKNIKVIATDIPSEVKGFEELKRRGNSVYPIDYAQVPETFNTPVRDILKAKNLENVKDVYLRAANSIDLLMNVQETSEHFKHISSTLKDKNVTYLYNNTILYKPAGSTKFKKLGNLNNSAFDHRSPSWKNNPNRNHYTLLPTNKTGGETGWLNKYK